MQITRHTDRLLVVHQGPWGVRIMGAVFAALGVGILAIILDGRLGEHNARVAMVVGGVFALAGEAMMLFASDVYCTADKTAGTVTIRRRGLGRASTVRYAFADIEDVALERSAMAAGSGRSRYTYRPVLLMKSGARIPWLSYYTGDLTSQANCVAAVRSFAGWHELSDSQLAADTGAAHRAAATTRSGRLLVLPVVGLFVAVGAGLFGLQIRRDLSWKPVRAVVTRSDVAAHHDPQHGDSYRPVISYAYTRDGTTQMATGATIVTESRGFGWADGIRKRYPTGDTVTAYINPARPDQGFVVSTLSWLPLVFVFGPLLIALLVIWGTNRSQTRLRLVGAQHVPFLPA